MKQESFLRSIGTAMLWKGLDRLTGLAKHIIIAAAIGLSAQLDVFYMTLALLGVLVFSWASMIDVVAVPSMVKAWQEGRRDEFKRIASGLFSFVLAASVLLAIILYLGKDLVAQVAIGFEAERRQLLADAIPWLLPVILLYIPLRLMGAVLRAIRQFSHFYQAEFLTALTVLVCVALFREDGHVLLWSFSVGVTSAFLFLLHKSRQFIFPLGIFAYAWMVLPLFLIGPLDQIFQVERRIGFMVRRTVLGMVANIVLNAWFLFGLGWGLFGIALATSISYWIMLTAGLHGLKKLGYHIYWARHLKWAGWISIFLTPIYMMSSFVPVSLTHGLPNLLVNVCAVLCVLLIAGLTYPGEESVSVRKTLYRFLPKAMTS